MQRQDNLPYEWALPIKPANPVSDAGVAWDMAYAEKPYQDQIIETKQTIPRNIVSRIIHASEVHMARENLLFLHLESRFAASAVRRKAVEVHPELKNELYLNWD